MWGFTAWSPTSAEAPSSEATSNPSPPASTPMSNPLPLPVDHTRLTSEAAETPVFTVQKWFTKQQVLQNGSGLQDKSDVAFSRDTHAIDTIIVKGESKGKDYDTSACIVLHPRGRPSPFIFQPAPPPHSGSDQISGLAGGKSTTRVKTPEQENSDIISTLFVGMLIGGLLFSYITPKPKSVSQTLTTARQEIGHPKGGGMGPNIARQQMLTKSGKPFFDKPTLSQEIELLKATNGDQVESDKSDLQQISSDPLPQSMNEVLHGMETRLSKALARTRGNCMSSSWREEMAGWENRLSKMENHLVGMESRLVKAIDAPSRDIEKIGEMVKKQALLIAKLNGPLAYLEALASKEAQSSAVETKSLVKSKPKGGLSKVDQMDSAPIAAGLNEARLSQVIRAAVEDVMAGKSIIGDGEGQKAVISKIAQAVRDKMEPVIDDVHDSIWESSSGSQVYKMDRDIQKRFDELKASLADAMEKNEVASVKDAGEGPVEQAQPGLNTHEPEPIMNLDDIRKGVEAIKARQSEYDHDHDVLEVERGKTATAQPKEPAVSETASAPNSGAKSSTPGKKSIKLIPSYDTQPKYGVDTSGDFTIAFHPREYRIDAEGFRHYQAALHYTPEINVVLQEDRAFHVALNPNRTLVYSEVGNCYIDDARWTRNINTKVFYEAGVDQVVIAEVDGRFWKCVKRKDDEGDIIYVVKESVEH